VIEMQEANAIPPAPGANRAQPGDKAITRSRRPMMDVIEVRVPGIVSLILRALLRMPAPVRRRVLASAFARAERAFNRGDFEAIVALWAEEVEYVPPPAIHTGLPISGRSNVLEFWHDVLARYERSRIVNLSVEALTPDSFVRTAKLCHDGRDGTLEYRIRQTTEVRRGRVVRQVNEQLSA
jgi:ketosteroid isomerase-like protein